jgi:hypothetical protein
MGGRGSRRARGRVSPALLPPARLSACWPPRQLTLLRPPPLSPRQQLAPMTASGDGHQKGTSLVRCGHCAAGRTQTITPGQRALGPVTPNSPGQCWWQRPGGQGVEVGAAMSCCCHAAAMRRLGRAAMRLASSRATAMRARRGGPSHPASAACSPRRRARSIRGRRGRRTAPPPTCWAAAGGRRGGGSCLRGAGRAWAAGGRRAQAAGVLARARCMPRPSSRALSLVLARAPDRLAAPPHRAAPPRARRRAPPWARRGAGRAARPTPRAAPPSPGVAAAPL